MKIALTHLAFAILLTSCACSNGMDATARLKGKEQKVTIGMTKSQVVDAIGEPTVDYITADGSGHLGYSEGTKVLMIYFKGGQVDRKSLILPKD